MNDELNELSTSLTKMLRAEMAATASRMKEGQASAADLRALTAAYESLVRTMRLQTGATGNPTKGEQR